MYVNVTLVHLLPAANNYGRRYPGLAYFWRPLTLVFSGAVNQIRKAGDAIQSNHLLWNGWTGEFVS